MIMSFPPCRCWETQDTDVNTFDIAILFIVAVSITDFIANLLKFSHMGMPTIPLFSCATLQQFIFKHLADKLIWSNLGPCSKVQYCWDLNV